MFVILQCWYNLDEEECAGKTLPQKVGLTMQHAGVAITVTSLTDVFAFGVGAVTVSNFCHDCPTSLPQSPSCNPRNL